MLKTGYIKLHRKMLDWEWYNDMNTFKMFVHLLLTVNISDTKYRGEIIKRGQRVITYPMLSKELKFSIQQTRTALEHLKSTDSITVWKTQNFSVVEVKVFHIYQASTDKSTDHQQTFSKKSTDHQQTHIDKKNKEEYYDKKVRHGRAHAHAREDGLTDEKTKSDFLEIAEDETASEDELHIWGGTLGRGVLYMSDKQFNKLIEMIPLEIFHGYVDKIVSYTQDKGKIVKDHYGKILKWFKTDYPKGV